jgi:glycosidase
VLREFAAHVRAVKPDAYTVGEVFDSLSAVLPYYPDQLDSYFAFELADSLVAAARTGNARGMLAPVLRLQEKVPHARWSPFLRNHDQPRTRTEVGGDPARARIASFLLMTMPGLPFVYYGEEIGMVGTKPDERLRTPMQWTAAPGGGFTTGQPWQQRQSDSASTTVEAQERDSASLLNLHRRLIRLRAANPALASGEIVPLTTTHDAVAAYLRRTKDRTVLVIANVGAAPVDGASVTAAPATFPAGQWLTRNLLGGPAAPPLATTDDGAVAGYVPLPTLAPLTGYLFEIETARVRKD